MKKILVTTQTFAKFSNKAIEVLEEAGLVVVRLKKDIVKEDDILNSLDDVYGIITGLEPITKKIIDSAKDLKVIAKHGVGIDNINQEAAINRGITVCNTPGANSDAVADFTFGLILSVARNIVNGDKSIHREKWPRLVGQSVYGKTIGIIGFGDIGKRIAIRAKGFNMRVLAYDIYWDEEFIKEYNIQKATLEEIYKLADFITLHVNLDGTTKNMIGINELKLMKNTAILINTSRGGVIDEDALYKALKNNLIAGAGIDVYLKEPVDTPLKELDNIVMTPHIAGYTDEALNMTSLIAAEKIVEVLNK